MESAEPPSKRLKIIKGPIYCLMPAEVEHAARKACETQKTFCRDLLWETKVENDRLKESNMRPKNKIVEQMIDENLDHVIKSITAQISANIREALSAKIYDQVEQVQKNPKLAKSLPAFGTIDVHLVETAQGTQPQFQVI